MKETKIHNERIAKMSFAYVYPHYITKVESKGRAIKELHQVIEWLSGFNDKRLLSKTKMTSISTKNCFLMLG
jgi:hypothetical protein